MFFGSIMYILYAAIFILAANANTVGAESSYDDYEEDGMFSSIRHWVPYLKRRHAPWSVNSQAFFIKRPMNYSGYKNDEASDILLTNARWITEIRTGSIGGYRFLPNFKRDYSVVFVDRNLFYKDNPIEANISNVIIHPEYRGKIDDEHDIAMVKLSRPVQLSEHVVAFDTPQWNISDFEFCILIGWNESFTSDKRSLKVRATELAITPNITSIDGRLESRVQNFYDNRTFWTSVGSPLICEKGNEYYAQGIVSRQFCRDNHGNCKMQAATYVDIFTHRLWLLNALDMIDTPAAFHSGLSAHDSKYSANIRFNSSYVDQWYKRAIYDKVFIKKRRMCVGTKNKGMYIVANAYECAIRCYMNNSGRSCYYVGRFKQCSHTISSWEPECVFADAITINFYR